ncbi:recombinase family protein [Roseinatronobacter bogoriensis]|uniref:Recombinase family protein n=1 Tax=Roseinatronobacter bogoriensis subsp. barguzinensis TaxID=441209 RepID=A0A2K8KIC5_9RHOB|nr:MULTISPECIES: recombinase family protein [Rhodobaca]ATX67525.1 recombinase family protein [Rhodobaca barguzinensis]MBB4209676.1 DNA invertase Pin-like site-specific DNA recombinase [Rhodobaca bogoriensis DSM 18756]TDW33851.1 DNA invertase Pin-like site-specific DNA recombinase [Rhodobaca barguzinensis]TDY66299.1 DNA invertase Pin-like site-specific DNA recombinase [Rhodobaca bogoriensis DSM 18756]
MTDKTHKRAVIYARYSTDMQSAASIADQVRICRKLAQERGWEVVEVFSDEALSGESHLRPGFQRLQQAALDGAFDFVVSEAMDRLSRDQEHIAGLHKRMRYLGIEIITKSEGVITEMRVGLGGTMSALFLRNLAAKTHRGLEGRVKAGKSAGGISYGYRLDRQPLPDGTFTTGDRVIDPDEAAIVRRIFEEYDQGRSARTIAMGLNKDSVPAPRAGGKGSGTWSFSTISGNWKRGTGILNNELYIGRLVWNRQRFVKDPDTNKRQARLNPPEEWVIHDVPDLRIIDDDLWERVKRRQGAIRDDIVTARDTAPDQRAPRAERGKRPSYLFSGLLRCGCCGSNYIMISATRYGCASARNKGTCDNRKTITRRDVETRILTGLRQKLWTQDMVREFIKEFHVAMRDADTKAARARIAHQKRLEEVTREITNMVDAIAKGMFHESMKARMDALEAERKDLEARLNALPDPSPIFLHPRLSDVYADKIEDLSAALDHPDTRMQAAELLRGLVERITLRPDPDAPNGHVIELYGELGAIIALCDGEGGTNANAHREGGRVGQVTMVAGTGFGHYFTKMTRYRAAP